MYKYKSSSDDVQRKRIITPSTFLKELCPFESFPMEIMSTLHFINRQRYFRETGYKNKLATDNVQRTRTIIPPTVFVKLCPFEIFLMKILSALLCNFTIVKDIFMKLGTNIKQHQKTCRE